MVNGGVPLMLKAIVSKPGLALAFKIAWRKEPGPLSAVEVTMFVSPKAVKAKAPAAMPGHNLPGHQQARRNFATPCIGLN